MNPAGRILRGCSKSETGKDICMEKWIQTKVLTDSVHFLNKNNLKTDLAHYSFVTISVELITFVYLSR